jgi:membrane protein
MLLPGLTAITGVVQRDHPKLQGKLLNSAFAEFPIVGSQIHQQPGVSAFGHTTMSLIVGLLGALYGARGCANAMQNTPRTGRTPTTTGTLTAIAIRTQRPDLDPLAGTDS